MTINKLLLVCSVILVFLHVANAADQPKLTLDEFFNYVAFDSVTISPDGNAVVIVTDRADWDQKIFRTDLWLYRVEGHGGSLIQLTQTGHERRPEWSPDGRWIAFISERKTPTKTHSEWNEDSEDDASREDETAHLYLISPTGGEAIQLTQGEEEIHAMSWSPDSKTLYFATRQPWTKDQKDRYRKEWKDVVQYRTGERGDTIFSLNVADAIVRQAAKPAKVSDESDNTPDVTPGSRVIAQTPLRVNGMDVSPDGHALAFLTESISERQESISEFEIYSVNLTNASPDQAPHQVTHNEALEDHIRWARDSKHIFFGVELGSVEGKYLDTQNRLYWVDAESGRTERWGGEFAGSIQQYYPASNSGVLATGRIGTEVQVYSQDSPGGPFSKQSGWGGTYEQIASAAHSPRIAFLYSALDKPAEVYIADGIGKLSEAHPITSFNQLFCERDLPKGKPYRWTADDGSTVEGMLMYPPGKFEAKNLPMFVFIHGGPADADGNHFEADWYQWDRLAATQGWLVFEPNYRGSTGYGDKFLEQIVPQIVSRPGKDVLEGVDALVKDGLADPNRLAIGGYSYGGYMTNWLITQTTRFKAAVTGAGAVEHVANWGNDDTTFDDAYFLGGTPWEAAQRYHDEAAIFQINKVRTPTHMVAGADDIRVAVAEDYLLDHALHNLGIPSTLLIFPGEGHSLDKDPWHGKIKVREELKWLEKYGGSATH
jgi:dipeptidyl aminopeptidase/acylaminoacyl peptidase